MTYRPLPPQVTIKESEIHGLGLFAKVDIKEDYEIGITHIRDDFFDDGYIRTPLGGFFNHSEVPNCECYSEGRFLKLRTIAPIKAGEELTVKYWLYEIK
tara:strand:+ start:7128 stop:7424 length:297 start_codon:yes stop_codon:yes gene_type:complete